MDCSCQGKTKDTSSVGLWELLSLLLKKKKHYCQSKSIYPHSGRNVHKVMNQRFIHYVVMYGDLLLHSLTLSQKVLATVSQRKCTIMLKEIRINVGLKTFWIM